MRKRIHIGEQLVGVHDVHVMNAPDGIGDDHGGFTVPGGQGWVIGNGRKIRGLGLFEPGFIDFSGLMPGSGEELHHHGEIHFVGFAKVHPAELTELQQNSVAFSVEVDALQAILGVVRGKIQARSPVEIGHELGFHHSGIEAHQTLTGVFRFQIGKALLTQLQIIDDDTFVEAPRDFAAAAVPLQIVGNDDLGEVHPFRNQVLHSLDGNPPVHPVTEFSGDGNNGVFAVVNRRKASIVVAAAAQGEFPGFRNHLSALLISQRQPENCGFFRDIFYSAAVQGCNHTGLLVKL